METKSRYSRGELQESGKSIHDCSPKCRIYHVCVLFWWFWINWLHSKQILSGVRFIPADYCVRFKLRTGIKIKLIYIHKRKKKPRALSFVLCVSLFNFPMVYTSKDCYLSNSNILTEDVYFVKTWSYGFSIILNHCKLRRIILIVCV